MIQIEQKLRLTVRVAETVHFMRGGRMLDAGCCDAAALREPAAMEEAIAAYLAVAGREVQCDRLLLDDGTEVVYPAHDSSRLFAEEVHVGWCGGSPFLLFDAVGDVKQSLLPEEQHLIGEFEFWSW